MHCKTATKGLSSEDQAPEAQLHQWQDSRTSIEQLARLEIWCQGVHSLDRRLVQRELSEVQDYLSSVEDWDHHGIHIRYFMAIV